MDWVGKAIFSGELFDVEAGMEAGLNAIGDGLLAGLVFIPRPHPVFLDVLLRSYG